jgi:DNA polymerase-3 subunit gamma/tau
MLPPQVAGLRTGPSMSYLALARRYRPRQFADVVGQPNVVRALQHALDGDRLHPAILLTGTRGVGKTTLARIVAKGLNCDTGISGNPCGVCSACLELDEGRFVDLLEIDAASNTGVDNVRELIDNSQYPPARGRYKVYLIDEVHMLSKSAFNALLKTLEEPPAHVKFILATTDPQKLPVTVLSRCLQLHLKRLPSSLIRDLLAKVLEAEQVAAEPAALAELARAADGSMRDGLSLLDQALVHAGGAALDAEGVRQMLGTGGRDALYSLLRALARVDRSALVTELQRLESLAPDYAALLTDLASMLQRIAVLQALPSARGEDDDDFLLALASDLAAADVHVYYDIAVHARRDLPWAPGLRAGFEIAVLRMLTFVAAAAGETPGDASGGAGNDIGGGRQASGGGVPGRAAADAATTPTAALIAEPAVPVETAPENGGARAWQQRVADLPLAGLARQLARNCAYVVEDQQTLSLMLPRELEHLHTPEREAELAKALGKQVRIGFESESEAEIATPAQLDREDQARALAAAALEIEKDPLVRAVKERFGAAVREGSVRLLH